MKYMGSKRAMLMNGLGETIAENVPRHRRFVDLFTGSGAVAWHVAQRYDIQTIATDLQQYSVSLASGVLLRTSQSDAELLRTWMREADAIVKSSELYAEVIRIQDHLSYSKIGEMADEARLLSTQSKGSIFSAYGGYYYSPLQALYLDAYRQTLPNNEEARALALASLIWVASRCAASPGHTAQPFKANQTAGKYLLEAWLRHPNVALESAIATISPQVAKRQGIVKKGDAQNTAAELEAGDLVFLDPPYSGVHYSRFYHVLETLATNELYQVSGNGRYPPIEARPQSDYSVSTASRKALDHLLSTLAQRGCSAIITFPASSASNGLSGEAVKEVAANYFQIKSEKVTSRFSTLGGNLRNRKARQASEELILTLRPQ